MKIFSIIVLTLITVTVKGQFDWNSKTWDNESLGFGCSVGGEMTRPVARASKLLLNGRFDDVKKLLYSDLPADQFLGVILVERLSKEKELKLNNDETKRIEQIKHSNEMVPVCSGCTYWDEVSLHDLLSSKDRLGAQYWFDSYYKPYRKEKKRATR
jgi:hypothetical protein